MSCKLPIRRSVPILFHDAPDLVFQSVRPLNLDIRTFQSARDLAVLLQTWSDPSRQAQNVEFGHFAVLPYALQIALSRQPTSPLTGARIGPNLLVPRIPHDHHTGDPAEFI